jgi:subtilisin family serine protease
MRSILLAAALFISAAAFSQERSKIPLSVELQTAGYPAGQFVSILVEGNPVEIAAAVKLHGGFMMHNEGTICSVQLPCGALHAFANEACVLRVGNAPVHQQVLNDTMKKQTGVNDVRAGLSPLSQGYTGAGIVMGIIDSGIDYHHPDFQDASGNTRIYKIWDQRDQQGPAAMPWNYGTLWDSASINNGTCTHNDLQYYGHGTHVSGIAGGNGNSTQLLDMSGVAPEVVYIVVALDFAGTSSSTAIADAAAYIYGQAQQLGMPCVINASVGDYYGSHDGQDLQSLMIDSMLNTPGRLFVSAAGNAGDLPIHVGYTLSNTDTNFTWFNVSNGAIYVQLWAEQNNFLGADFAIGCTRPSDWTDLDRTSFTDIAANLQVSGHDTLWNASGQRLATIQRIATTQGSAYSMEFLIVPDSLAYHFGLYMTGSGAFDCWSFDFVTNGLPTAGQYPAIADYRNADLTQNMVGGFQCSERVVCVANYVNRDEWPNYAGTISYDTTVTAGEMMWNSSFGPSRDGKVKPDIAAPGANDMSCIETNSRAAILAGAPQACAPGGWHVQGGGTSAASPVVAGTGALWLERFPNATWREFRDAVIWCAKRDTFTGNNLPDYSWGYGKIDAWAMMVNCASSLDVQEPAAQSGMIVYPNPSEEATGVTIQLSVFSAATPVNIYNTTGALVYVGYTDASGKLVVNGLTAGMYVATVQQENAPAPVRFVVQ